MSERDSEKKTRIERININENPEFLMDPVFQELLLKYGETQCKLCDEAGYKGQKGEDGNGKGFRGTYGADIFCNPEVNKNIRHAILAYAGDEVTGMVCLEHLDNNKAEVARLLNVFEGNKERERDFPLLAIMRELQHVAKESKHQDGGYKELKMVCFKNNDKVLRLCQMGGMERIEGDRKASSDSELAELMTDYHSKDLTKIASRQLQEARRTASAGMSTSPSVAHNYLDKSSEADVEQDIM